MDNKELSLRDIWEYLWGNLLLFAGSVFFTLGLALIYIVITPPQYYKSASILIKDDMRNQMYGGGTQKLEDMGLFKSYTDVNNELYMLKTPRLMYSVVERLGIDYSYSVKYRGLRWVELYRNSPFEVDLGDVMVNNAISFEITFEDGCWEITDLVINLVEYDDTYTGQFGVPCEQGVLQGVTIKQNNSTLSSSNAFSFSKVSKVSAAVRYSSALNVMLANEESSIVDISIVDCSCHRASDIVNTLIDVYKENWIKERNKVTVSTSQFINERLRVIEQELGSVDSQISSYKSDNLLPDIGVVTAMNLRNTESNALRQLELSNQLSMAKYVQSYMADAQNKDQLLPVNTGINNSAVESMISRYNEQLLVKTSLLSNSSEHNPIIVDMTQNLESTRQIIDLSITDLIETLNLQIENERRDEVANTKKLASNPEQELYLLSAGREQKVKESLYLFLLQKREENELTQAFTAYNTVTLNLAQPNPTSPVAPRRTFILLLALAVGLIFPIIFLLIKESFNTLVRSKEDIKGLKIPYIGSVPQVKSSSNRTDLKRVKALFGKRSRKDETPQVIIGDKSRSVANEAFRIVRTNLDFIGTSESGCKVSIITSINPGSGKSFISANLSLSMAVKNAKVLAIDTDMRRATLSSYISSPKVGLSNYLSGGVTNVDDVIVKGTLHPNMDVLPVGTIPPNPSELLLLDRFEQLISDLRGRYDYIFMDGTPVDVVPDATIAERVCDSTIFVIRAGLMDKRLLPELEAIYDGKSFKNMLLLLNGVDYNRSGYYGYGHYGKYGYSQYGESYGYGDND